jgi:hypothetical protein
MQEAIVWDIFSRNRRYVKAVTHINVTDEPVLSNEENEACGTDEVLPEEERKTIVEAVWSEMTFRLPKQLRSMYRDGDRIKYHIDRRKWDVVLDLEEDR